MPTLPIGPAGCSAADWRRRQGSAYLRRWSIDPLQNSTNNTWILQVRVTDLRTHDVAGLVAARTGKVF